MGEVISPVNIRWKKPANLIEKNNKYLYENVNEKNVKKILLV